MDVEFIDLRIVFGSIWEKRWWVLACVLLFSAMFTAAAFLITPIYRASVVLVPASAERSSISGSLSTALGQLGGLASLAGVNVGAGNSETEESLAVLRSRQFTERFISEESLLPILFSSKWNAANGTWNVADEDRPTLAEAYKYFNKRLRTISQDKKTGLVTLQIDWKDRNEAAAWANQLVQRLNAEMRTRAIEKAEASLGFLQNELAKTSDISTRDAISRLIETQIKQRMLANVTLEYAFRVVDRAMPADKNDPEFPQKQLFFLLGPLVGLVVGALGVFVVAFSGHNGKRVED